MSIRYRPMRPNDVQDSIQIVSAHPIVAARYGSFLPDLKSVWLRLLANEGFAAAAVVEENVGGRIRIPAIGVSAFVSDDFVRELKTPPHFWIGPELLRRIVKGDSPLLSLKQVREANSLGGLNLVVWHGCLRIEDNSRTDVWYELTAAFLEYHRGFLLKELVAQAESVEHLVGMRNTGAILWNAADSCYREFWEADANAIVAKPHLAGLTRDVSVSKPGSWGGSLFLYTQPRFGFSRSEQRLLLCALSGGTDEQIADKLGITVAAVKKAWRRIYERCGKFAPHFITDTIQEDGVIRERGKGKKQHLLAHVREHPEELRPVSRKLLQGARAIRSTDVLG